MPVDTKCAKDWPGAQGTQAVASASRAWAPAVGALLQAPASTAEDRDVWLRLFPLLVTILRMRGAGEVSEPHPETARLLGICIQQVRSAGLQMQQSNSVACSTHVGIEATPDTLLGPAASPSSTLGHDPDG
jgi:hypothetical protein